MLASIRPPAMTPFPSAEAHPLDRPGQTAIQAGLRLPPGQAGGRGDAGLTALRAIRRPHQMPDLLPGVPTRSRIRTEACRMAVSSGPRNLSPGGSGPP